MSYEPPTPPAALPTEIVNTLNGYSPDQLQHVARYAEALAEYKYVETSSRWGYVVGLVDEPHRTRDGSLSESLRQRVRFRVELYREDNSNEPRLTQLTCQWRP